ncbi:MAG: acetyl-CoA C-acetyltransferase, partial [Mycobacterium sp.]
GTRAHWANHKTIAGALEKAFPKAAEPASLVEYVIMGQVLTAGAGQMPARQAAVAAGIGWDVPSLTINKMCLSGIDAIALADQLIRAGEFDVVVAGGQESMTKAPHLLMDSRSGYKYGDVSVLDHMAYDGLHDIFTDQPMGALTEQRNDADQFTRAEQDEFAAASHQKAAAAWKDGVYADEVVPVSIPQRKGDPIEFTQDEGIRANTTAESLAGLRPAFRKDGTITAGSASQISDGACAVVVMNKAKAEELGLSWLCEIGAHGVVAGPDSTLQSQPANAIRRAVAKEGITLDQLDVIEINEAFSAVALASTRELGVDPDRVNTNGGAIAIGHPIGMSGARITLHVALELARLGERSDGESGLGERSDGETGRGERSDGARYGVAALCGAGGQGDALILRCP